MIHDDVNKALNDDVTKILTGNDGIKLLSDDDDWVKNITGPVAWTYFENRPGHQNAPTTGPVGLLKNNASQ